MIAVHPASVRQIGGQTVYYFGADPAQLNQLPTGAEFSIVFSGSWKSVRFIVHLRDGVRTYSAVSERVLEPDEIAALQAS